MTDLGWLWVSWRLPVIYLCIIYYALSIRKINSTYVILRYKADMVQMIFEFSKDLYIIMKMFIKVLS